MALLIVDLIYLFVFFLFFATSIVVYVEERNLTDFFLINLLGTIWPITLVYWMFTNKTKPKSGQKNA